MKSLERWYRLENALGTVPYVYEFIEYVRAQTKIGSSEGLLDLAHKVATRTAQPTPFNFNCTLQDFVESVIGDNLCWEQVGPVLDIAGMSALIVDEVRELDDTDKNVDWKQMARTFFRAGSECMQICNEYGHLNDLGMNLMILDLLLHTQVHGDSGL